jgi:hypothetical protein
MYSKEKKKKKKKEKDVRNVEADKLLPLSKLREPCLLDAAPHFGFT